MLRLIGKVEASLRHLSRRRLSFHQEIDRHAEQHDQQAGPGGLGLVKSSTSMMALAATM